MTYIIILSVKGVAPNLNTRKSDTGLERSTETKASTKTSEFFVYLVVVYLVGTAAILIASLIMDGFNATEGWMFFTFLSIGFLSIGYMISRGLAKSGSREPYRADR